jgi:hypothetical protein
VLTLHDRLRVRRWVASDQQPPPEGRAVAAKVVRSMTVVRPTVRRAWGAMLVVAAVTGLLFSPTDFLIRAAACLVLIAYAMWQFRKARQTEDAVDWADRYLESPSNDRS